MNDPVRLVAQTLTAEAFARFGTVFELPSRTPDASGPGWTWWGEIAYLDADSRRYGIGYLDLQPSQLQFEWAERHMQSLEILIPINGDCLISVGPPDYLDDPGRLPPLDQFHAFRIRQGQGAVLARGAWHGAPMATNSPLAVVVLLLEGTGRNDSSLVRFADTPVQIDLNL